jgi:hypothetical protein
VRLLAEHEEAGAFLSIPAPAFDAHMMQNIPSQRLSNDEVLAGRFRVIRFLASGGPETLRPHHCQASAVQIQVYQREAGAQSKMVLS